MKYTPALLGALAVAGVATGQNDPTIASIQVPATTVVTGVLATDVDGDGLTDLVLACRDSAPQRRELRLHLRKAGQPCFGNEPSKPPQPIEKDVIAFTYADCDPSPGRELVLLTGPGVAETIDWAGALPELDKVALDPETLSDTIGVLLKYQDEIARIDQGEGRRILKEVQAELSAAAE